DLAVGAFDKMGVVDFPARHLVAAADSHDHGASVLGRPDALIKPGVDKQEQILHGVLRAWDDHHVGVLYVSGADGILKLHVRLAKEGVEIGEIGDVAEPHHDDPDRTVSSGHCPVPQRKTVFFGKPQIGHVGKNAYHRPARGCFYHVKARL